MPKTNKSISIFELTPHCTEDYFESVLDLLSEQMKFVGRKYSREEIKEAVLNAIRPDTRAYFFTAEDTAGEVIGVCLVNICSGIEASGDYIWINEIHTRSDMRTKGIGQALLRHIIKWGESLGCRYANAITSPTNEIAQNLCRSVGFSVSKVTWLDKPLT